MSCFRFSCPWKLTILVVFLSACSGSKNSPVPAIKVAIDSPSELEDKKGPGSARIIMTEYGVPHIEASNWRDLGHGAAYAFAGQNVCILADQLLKTRSERSKYFGPGANNENLISDVSNLALDYIVNGRALYPKLSRRARSLIRGYANGYNQYLRDIGGVDYLPRPCRGAAWVQPTTEYELLAYYLTLAERARPSARRSSLIDPITNVLYMVT